MTCHLATQGSVGSTKNAFSTEAATPRWSHIEVVHPSLTDFISYPILVKVIFSLTSLSKRIQFASQLRGEFDEFCTFNEPTLEAI